MENKTKTNQGRSFLGRVDADERARFSTYVISHLDKWRYENPGTNTWPTLAERVGVSVDQVSRWLKSEAVPSREAMNKLCVIGVFGAVSSPTLHDDKPWMTYEPALMKTPQKKKRSQPIKEKAAKPELEVSPPEFEVAEIDIHDAISRLEIAVKAKMQLSALVALAESGAVFDLDVKVRAR